MNYQIFQEKYTSGRFRHKKVYYVYYRYFEGSMIAVSKYTEETIKSLEKK